MKIVEALQLSKWFKAVRGVSDISFEFEGGVLGLLGPNGAGKSTLLKLLSGQCKPTRGDIYVFGERIWNNYPLMKRIGFSPEQDNFYEWQTGRAFLEFLGTLAQIPQKDLAQQVNRALDLTDMTVNANRPISTYSKGMRQRLKVAQALLHNPDLIILDEPLNGTDPEGRHKLVELVKDLGKQGKHIIVSSHILHEVDSMTDNILLLLNGHVKACGRTSDLRKLFGEKPTKVHLRCPHERALAKVFAEENSVQSLQILSNELVLEITNLTEFYQRLSDLIRERVIEIEEIFIPDENLEAIFKYLAGDL